MVLLSGSEKTLATRAGRERQPGEPLRIGRPRHDVDPLAAELVDDRLHPGALEPDAGADRIDGVVAGDHRHLGAAADFARDGADLDDLLLDLGHLELEQRLDEQRIAPREDEPRPLGRLLQPLEHGADGVALVEMLAVVLLAVGDDRLGLAELVQHDDELAALDLLHLAGEQLAHLAAELVADPRALALAHPLDDPLLGRLHGQPAELGEGNVLLQHVAHDEVGILEPGVLERDLPARVFHRLHHLAQPDDADGAVQLVHAELELDVRAELADERGLDAVAQELEELRAIELLRGGQLAERGQHFRRSRHAISYLSSFRRSAGGAQSYVSRASRTALRASVRSDAIGQPDRHVLVVGHAPGSRPPAARQRRRPGCARGAPRSGASAPASGSAARCQVRRLRARSAVPPAPGTRAAAPARRLTDGALLRRDAVAGGAVRTVDPELKNGTVQRSGAAEIDQLETERGDVLANRAQQPIERFVE